MKRIRIKIKGCVQGIGFRPFVYRIATQLGLKGFIKNTFDGVLIEVEGKEYLLDEFIKKLKRDKPYLAIYHFFEFSEISLKYNKEFKIIKSEKKGERESFILPDIATCKLCIEEIFNKNNKRYLYPFTNCTFCGPRFSIIEDLPYDRNNTTMKLFKMCESCREEYNNPMDRRFHAQPNACPNCGPKIYLLDSKGKIISKKDALERAATIIRDGKILALKGLGGYQLLVDARNENAVINLRKIKKRKEKPFAVMFPDLEILKKYVILGDFEIKLLESIESPIVLLRKKKSLAKSLAPGNSYIGAMLPYTPLHHILMYKLQFPVVCTSGNISDEPIIIEDKQAISTLKADYFLVHNRPIKRPVDDSVVRAIVNKKIIIRRARGYVPLPIIVEQELPNILAVGAHLKNTVSISKNNKIFISQHIGDMNTWETFKLFKKIIRDFKNIYKIKPEGIVCDAHPEYITTKFAENIATKNNLSLIKVYHHHAHIASCMLDNNLGCKVLGVAWDGAGYGLDKTIWGGEFLLSNYENFSRVASFRPFYLIGGERAIREPRRILLSILYEIYGENCFELNFIKNKFSKKEINILKKMIGKDIMLFKTSSVGRLFDAVASILNLKQKLNFEGQGAIMVESIAENTSDSYSFKLRKSDIWIINWEPLFLEIIDDIKHKINLGIIAGKFHNTLVKIIGEIARKSKIKKIVLSGGVFQNSYLTRKVVSFLGKNFEIYIHDKIPPNDAGISVGQVIIGANKLCV